MNIAVCIKWVPVVSRMKFDTETKRIVREGVPSEVNGYDIVAVQRAAELRDQLGGHVTAITMGPPQARDGLTRCLAQGADDAIHVNDAACAGSDTLATSRVLAAVLKREPYDLVLFGNYSVDAETGQVGPEVAEMLGFAQVTGASKIDVVDGGRAVRVQRMLEDGAEVVEATLPAVVTVADGVASDAFPGREALQAAKERDIPEITIAELGLDPQLIGFPGSPTWVSEIRIQESTREPLIIEEVPVDEAARQVVAFLKDRGVLDPANRVRPEPPTAPSDVRSPTGPGVWVVAELGDDGPLQVTYELLGAAQSVADSVEGHVAALLRGGPGVSGYAAALGQRGADLVAIAEDASLAGYSTDAYAGTLANAIRSREPYAVLLPSSPNGRDLAARVAGRLELGLTGDCIGLEVDEKGLVQLKPAFGGSVVAPIYSRTLPNMATVRAGVLPSLAPEAGRRATIVQLDPAKTGDVRVRRLEKIEANLGDAADFDSAWAVIGIGNGVGGAEFLGEVDPLRDLLGAKYATTRDVADAGWMPRQLQVGLTGRSIAPNLYIGVALRGDFNHLVGLRRAGVLVCVNNNRRASIFRGGVDVAVLADWHEFVPALKTALEPEL